MVIIFSLAKMLLILSGNTPLKAYFKTMINPFLPDVLQLHISPTLYGNA